MITAIELRERLQYDPNTGRWIWLKSLRFGWVGRPAGSMDTKGYWIIKIDGQSYKASRLAYLYMTGEWPEEEMDHINRKPWDDSWVNLRSASRSVNCLNRVWTGASGIPGVYAHTHNNSWVAQHGRIYIGSYETIEEAIAAREAFIAKRNAS